MNNLKKLRERYNLSFRALDEKVGIDFSTLSQLEKNGIKLTMNTISKLIDFYNVTSDYLIGASDYGFHVIYKYKEKEEASTITEAELNYAKEQHCLFEDMLPHKIERCIQGTLAKVYFEKKERKKEDEELYEAWVELSKEEKEMVTKYAKFMLLEKKAKEVADGIKDLQEKLNK